MLYFIVTRFFDLSWITVSGVIALLLYLITIILASSTSSKLPSQHFELSLGRLSSRDLMTLVESNTNLKNMWNSMSMSMGLSSNHSNDQLYKSKSVNNDYSLTGLVGGDTTNNSYGLPLGSSQRQAMPQTIKNSASVSATATAMSTMSMYGIGGLQSPLVTEARIQSQRKGRLKRSFGEFGRWLTMLLPFVLIASHMSGGLERLVDDLSSETFDAEPWFNWPSLSNSAASSSRLILETKGGSLRQCDVVLFCGNPSSPSQVPRREKDCKPMWLVRHPDESIGLYKMTSTGRIPDQSVVADCRRGRSIEGKLTRRVWFGQRSLWSSRYSSYLSLFYSKDKKDDNYFHSKSKKEVLPIRYKMEGKHLIVMKRDLKDHNNNVRNHIDNSSRKGWRGRNRGKGTEEVEAEILKIYGRELKRR